MANFQKMRKIGGEKLVNVEDDSYTHCIYDNWVVSFWEVFYLGPQWGAHSKFL